MIEKKAVGKMLVLVTLLLFLAACSTASETPEVTEAVAESLPTAEPDPAPDFTLTSLEGEKISLSDYEGEWLILNFWATWCPPCVSEMPYLQTLADRDLNVLGVNMAEDADLVKLFTVKYGIEFPILMDPYDNLVLDYQARALPRTVIINPDGDIALRISGPIDGERLDPWLDDHGVR
jgi:thiol-disulfide isomerase/thioredoxin